MRDWTEEETFSLIKEYKARKVLWEKHSPFFKNVDRRSRELGIISKKFRNCTSSDVKEKLRSLRNVYMEKIRTIRKSQGTSAEPKWRYFSALSFLQGELSNSTIKDNTDNESKSTCLPQTIDSSLSRSPIHIPKKKQSGFDFNTNSHDLRGNDISKFLNFVKSSLEQLQESDLKELAQIKIRLLLAKISQADCNRQQKRFEEKIEDEEMTISTTESTVSLINMSDVQTDMSAKEEPTEKHFCYT